jgi:hypothetical protein
MTTQDFTPQLASRLPSLDRSVVAIEPPGREPGSWAGASSAVLTSDGIVMAYRMRTGSQRGCEVAIARSADGVRFETIQLVTKEEMDCESLERPALVLTDWGTWRLYLSCATWRTKHWRVELIESPVPDAFDSEKRLLVLPGDAASAVKDPVIKFHNGTWHLWASVHPLADPAATDRMTTDYACSTDGIDWTWRGRALTGRPGGWDRRGVRVSAVRFEPSQVIAYYDGRASAAENYEERTGIAAGLGPEALAAIYPVPIGSGPDGLGGLRYLDILDLGDGHERWYYEVTRPDGLHELRTELRQG